MERGIGDMKEDIEMPPKPEKITVVANYYSTGSLNISAICPNCGYDLKRGSTCHCGYEWDLITEYRGTMKKKQDLAGDREEERIK